MKRKNNLVKIIPLFVVAASVCSCTVFSKERLDSAGVKDVYAYEYEDERKSEMSCTYQNLYDNYIYTIDNLPSTGNRKILVIPVWFTDSNNYIPSESREDVRNDIFNAYFGDESKTGWRSVAGFYKQESFNKLNLSGTVSGWYEPNTSSFSYNNSDSTVSLVKSACEWFKQNNSDYSSFDTDGDGYIDAVSLVYGCPDSSTYQRVHGKIGPQYSDNMWAYTYWIQESRVYGKAIPNSFTWISYDFMYDSSKPKIGSYGYGDCDNCKIDAHTFIHESGHLLGLQDYYDYAGTTYGYAAAGVFSMQDSSVGGHDPYSKIALGWTKPYVIKDSTTITIKPNQESGDIVLISADPDYANSPFDEFLLIELYTPTGLNALDATYKYCGNKDYKGPTASGCRVWHVDGRLGSPNKVGGKYEYPKNTTSIYTVPQGTGLYGYKFEQAVTNTTKRGTSTEGHHTKVSEFENYRLLNLIRRNRTSYKTIDRSLTNESLFITGDTFSMATRAGCFPNNGLMNTGLEFNYSIEFTSVTSSGATLTITKN